MTAAAARQMSTMAIWKRRWTWAAYNSPNFWTSVAVYIFSPFLSVFGTSVCAVFGSMGLMLDWW